MLNTAYGVSIRHGQHYSKHEQTSSYSLLASQSSCPQLDHEDLDQVDEYDLEEMDLKWQVAMISMRIKKFYKKTGRKLQFDAKEPVGFDKTKVECYNCHKTGHFARECRTKEDNRRRDGWNPGNKDGKRTERKEESRAMVTVDGECVDWTTHSEDDENFAFMASNSSGSNTHGYSSPVDQLPLYNILQCHTQVPHDFYMSLEMIENGPQQSKIDLVSIIILTKVVEAFSGDSEKLFGMNPNRMKKSGITGREVRVAQLFGVGVVIGTPLWERGACEWRELAEEFVVVVVVEVSGITLHVW
ncbi:ribonuclease H-like domain-containing protein [Tanacetum coccineum]